MLDRWDIPIYRVVLQQANFRGKSTILASSKSISDYGGTGILYFELALTAPFTDAIKKLLL